MIEFFSWLSIVIDGSNRPIRLGASTPQKMDNFRVAHGEMDRIMRRSIEHSVSFEKRRSIDVKSNSLVI